MKRKITVTILSLLCAILCAFGLVACASKSNNSSNPSPHTHSYAWTDNNDGTHNGYCSASGCDNPYITAETHTYDASGKCKCGKNKPTQSESHMHNWSVDWRCDKTQHWHYCTECSEKKDAVAHTPGAAATQTTSQVCTVCGYVIANPIGHTHSTTPVSANSATCTTNGNIAYYTCFCGRKFSDVDATNEITDDDIVINKLGHNWETEWTVDIEATTEHAGSKSHHCTRCSEKTGVTEIPRITITTYNVIFNANGGKIDGKETKTITGAVNQTISRPNDPVRTDYTFTGWYKDGGTTTLWNFDIDKITGVTTLYAGWELNIPEYNVTFVHNYSGSSNIVKSTEHGLITYIPTRSGYIFNGWYYSVGQTSDGSYILSEKFDTSERVTQSGLTLYAEWVLQRTDDLQLYSPSVSISEDGVFSWSTIENAQNYRVEVYSGYSQKVAETVYATSWTFPNGMQAGYYTVKIRANGDGENTINSVYTEKYYSHHILGTIQELNFNVSTSILTWSAVKSATAYEVRINNELKTTISYTTYDLSDMDAGNYTVSVTPIRENYSSSAYTTSIIKKRLKTPTVTITENVNCSYTISWVAVANADTYRIKHHDTFINVTETSYTVTNDSAIYNSNGIGEFTVCAYDSNADYLISGDSNSVTVKKIFALKLNISDDAAGTVSSAKLTYKVGDSVIISASTNKGYTWIGWYDGNKEITKELNYSFTMPNENKTLTAKWTLYMLTVISDDGGAVTRDYGASSYTVSFDLNGATGAAPQQQTVTKTNGLTYPEIPERGGYLFGGWYETPNCIGSPYDFSQGVESDIQLYAKWVTYTGTPIKNSNNFDGIAYYYADDFYEYYAFVPLTNEIEIRGIGRNSMIGYILDSSKKSIDSASSKYNSGSISYYSLDMKCSVIPGELYYLGLKPVNSSAAGLQMTMEIFCDKKPNDGGNLLLPANGGTISGKDVTLTATTNTGYTWVGWYNGVQKLTDELSYTFTMPSENVTYTAKWCKVTTESSDSAAGSVSGLNSTYLVGDNAVVTATTNVGYTFIGWYNGTQKLTDKLSYTFTMPNENVTYTAKWCKVTIVSDDESAGSVSGMNYTYKVGESTTVSASTNIGYTWVGWYNGVQKLTDELSYTFTMPSEDKTYTAKWCKVTTESSNSAAGSVSALTEKYKVDDSATVTATTNVGYTFIGWYNGTQKLTDKLSYTFTMPNESITYTAKWCKITTESSDSAAGSVGGLNSTYLVGDNAVIIATANRGYIFTGWYDGTQKLTDELSYTFTMPSQNKTFTAEFTIDPQLKDYTFTTTENSFIITGVTNKTAISITIPDYVTGIGDSAFRNCTELRSILIPEGVTRIGDSAFRNCTELRSILIPEGVTSINSLAFSGCTALTNIIIPDTVTYIGNSLLYGCSSLESITIPFLGDQIKRYNQYYQYPLGYIFGTSYYTGSLEIKQYYYGSNLNSTTDTTYYIPSSLKNVTVTGGNILYGAFSNCEGLNITFEDGVMEIVKGALNKCSVESLTIPFLSNDLSIMFGATNSTDSSFVPSSLKTVIITGGSRISYGAFYNCKHIEVVQIPEGIMSIQTQTFYGCTSLKKVTLPDSITSIEYEAFYDCSALEEINVPCSVTSIGDCAFYNTAWYNNQSDGLVYAGKVAYKYKGDMPSNTIITLKPGTKGIADNIFKNCNSLKSIIIPNDLKTIGNYAFYDCKSLSNITIPNSVTSIGNYAFSGSAITKIVIPDSVISIGNHVFDNCYSLKNITVEVNNPNYASQDGILYDNTKTTFIHIPYKLGGTVVIPDGVTTIDVSYFSGRTLLASIVIPNSVTSIGKGAFTGCTSLTSITISSNITSIDDNAFQSCDNLSQICYMGEIKSWCEGGFCKALMMRGVKIKALFINGKEISEELIIPDGVTSIADYAFYGCSSLTSITIPKSVTFIGSCVFSYCDALKSIEVETNNSNYASQDGILYNKTKTDFIHIPKAIRGVVSIPNGVTSIKSSDFSGCSALISLTIPESVATIDGNAFKDCLSLTIYCEAAYKPNGWNDDWNNWTSYSNSYSCCVIWDCKNNDKDDDGFAYFVIDGIRYSLKDGIATVIRQSKSLSGAVVIPSTVTYLNKVYNVTTIGAYAFADTSLLTSIIIPNSVTHIESYAFNYCSYLTSITIPESVTIMEGVAFQGYGKLIIYCEAASCPSEWDFDWNYHSRPVIWNCKNSNKDNAGYEYREFGGILYSFKNGIAKVVGQSSSITGNITIPSSITYNGDTYSVTTIGAYAFQNCSLITSITIPDSTITIEEYAFKNCKGITSLIIPNNVSSIGKSILSGCSSLESITIPFVGDSVKSSFEKYQYPFGYIFGSDSYTGSVSVKQSYYGSSTYTTTSDTYQIPISLKEVTVTGGQLLYGAFEYCNTLISITIPENITSIGKYAFFGCTSLASIIIPNNVTTIEESAFGSCSKLESIKLPDNVRTIGNRAFSNCSLLSNIALSTKVTSIGDYAFSSCAVLSSINYDGNTEQWESISKGTNWDYDTAYYIIYCNEEIIKKG